MKRLLFFCIFILAIFLPVIADDGKTDETQFENPKYTQRFIDEQEQMLQNIENYFPRLLLDNKYDLPSAPVTSTYDTHLYTAEVHNGKLEISFIAKRILDDEIGRGPSFFNITGSYQNFYFHVDMKLKEQDKSGKGWCCIQYSNGEIVGESKRSSVQVKYPLRVEKYITKLSGREYTTLYDLSEFENDDSEHTLEMIRLDGYTSVFIDHHFIVGFEDEFDGRFSHMFAVGLQPGGEYASYEFDNFILRIR